MKQINTIAWNTVKEIYRDKVFYSIFIFAIFIIILTYFLGQLTYRDEVKITMDLGLAVINLSSLIMAIFLGATLLSKEIDKKSIYIIIAKSVGRTRYILGKFFGLSILIFINVTLMGAIVAINVLILKGTIPLVFFQALLLMYFEMLIIVAFGILFSIITTVTLATMFSLGIYVIAHSASSFELILKKAEGLQTVMLSIVNWLIPNFEFLNLKNLLPYVYVVRADTILLAISYALLIIIITMVISMVLFSRKDFK